MMTRVLVFIDREAQARVFASMGAFERWHGGVYRLGIGPRETNRDGGPLVIRVSDGRTMGHMQTCDMQS